MLVKFIAPVVLLTTPIHAQTVSPVVGHVDKMSCPVVHYLLNNKPEMKVRLTQVRQGDKIALDKTQVALEFREMSTGQLVKVAYGQLPFEVESPISLVKSVAHCDLTSYRIKRQQGDWVLSEEMTLQKDDRIEWDPAQSVLTIQGTSLLKVKYSELPYVVPLTWEVSTIPSNFWEWFKGWFTELEQLIRTTVIPQPAKSNTY